MQTQDDSNGAMVNEAQLLMMQQLFGIHPWSYYKEDPFELAERLSNQERALEELKR